MNGCGVARDASGRGLSVLLVEKGDLASATSSASTKLIHGGLRYLEHHAFGLVRAALREREVLLRAAPHIIRPLRFVLPHVPAMRPAWMIRIGLFLYDHLGRRTILPGSRGLDLRHDPAGHPLRDGFRRGFEYSDCQVDDSRLVVLSAMDAARRGADIRPRTRLERARCEGGLWRLELRAAAGMEQARARVLVNAAGPWVAEVAGHVRCGPPMPGRVRLVKGSHIVVPRLYGHDRAYIFQNDDGRIVFAIPWQEDFTLIGTTDVEVSAPDEAHITEDEIAYLLAAVNRYFRSPVRAADVVWSFSGIRPLYDDGRASAKDITREHVLELVEAEAPLLTIHGGKITAFREVAQEVMERLAPFFPGMGGDWTEQAPLPGGDFPVDGLGALVDALRRKYPWLEEKTAWRLARAHGTLAEHVLGDAAQAADMGRDFGAGLCEREVRYLMEAEWARTAEDILWRRSKLGLRLSARQAQALEAFMASCTAG